MNYSELLNSLKIRGSQPHGSSKHGGEESSPQARACPSLHSLVSLPPLTFFTPLPLVPRAAAHAPAVCKFLPSSPPPSSPPPPLPSFPPSLLPSSPLSPLLVASVPFTRSSLRSTCLLSLCSRLRRATTLSLSSLPFPPPSPFISPCFFLPLHLTLLAMRVA